MVIGCVGGRGGVDGVDGRGAGVVCGGGRRKFTHGGKALFSIWRGAVRAGIIMLSRK